MGHYGHRRVPEEYYLLLKVNVLNMHEHVLNHVLGFSHGWLKTYGSPKFRTATPFMLFSATCTICKGPKLDARRSQSVPSVDCQ